MESYKKSVEIDEIEVLFFLNEQPNESYIHFACEKIIYNYSPNI